jgi:hypothetical protein
MGMGKAGDLSFSVCGLELARVFTLAARNQPLTAIQNNILANAVAILTRPAADGLLRRSRGTGGCQLRQPERVGQLQRAGVQGASGRGSSSICSTSSTTAADRLEYDGQPEPRRGHGQPRTRDELHAGREFRQGDGQHQSNAFLSNIATYPLAFSAPLRQPDDEMAIGFRF